MLYCPKDEGLTHINSYSKSSLLCGKVLSNFAPIELNTPYGVFHNIESLWIYLRCGDNRLHDTYNPLDARKIGNIADRNYLCGKIEFESIIRDAIYYKLNCYSEFLLSDKYFTDLNLEIIHNWVRNGEYVTAGNSSKLLVNSIITWRVDKLLWKL